MGYFLGQHNPSNYFALTINVYVELEKEFDIHFKEKDIVAGKFDTFDDIIKLINKEIAYKTRGKEHA